MSDKWYTRLTLLRDLYPLFATDADHPFSVRWLPSTRKGRKQQRKEESHFSLVELLISAASTPLYSQPIFLEESSHGPCRRTERVRSVSEGCGVSCGEHRDAGGGGGPDHPGAAG